MKTELIESLDFTEEDYNEKIAGEDVASFNEFIEPLSYLQNKMAVLQNDAIIMANDTYYQL